MLIDDPVLRPPLSVAAPVGVSSRSLETGKYRNLFREIGKSDEQICAKVNSAWQQIFYGSADERLYFPTPDDTAYIKDTGSDDVRTEGMSYGMMIAVQLNRQQEFDRLWKWAKVNMQLRSGPLKGYFAWSCDENGNHKSEGPAPDGEEYFATALFFADARWGSKQGICNYRAEADGILHDMLHKDGDLAMFNKKYEQIVFAPNGDAATFTDASYHLPAFYEVWARCAKENRGFWKSAAKTSRAYFHLVCDAKTGLAPDHSSFEGKPMKSPWDPQSKGDTFAFDAFRVAGNIAMDYAWSGADRWQVEQSNRLLDFFAVQKPTYVSNYTLDGTPLVDYKSTGLVAMNAVAALAATTPNTKSFVQALWDAPIPNGKYRYYDGMLYLLGLLHASGQFKVWLPNL